MSWQDDAACRGMDQEMFFPTGPIQRRRRLEERAKAICGTCPVVTACLMLAIEMGPVGVWGGMTEADREALAAVAGVDFLTAHDASVLVGLFGDA